eukprot:Skav227574  [mRNA]  locus=scaffold154:229860:234654:- [translate_table: standard]
MKASLCYPLGSGIFHYLMYFASATNRADGPTRNTSPKPPSLPLPSWIDDILDGDFEPFEDWLREAEAGVVQEPFDFDALMGGGKLDLKPRARLKKRERKAKKAEPRVMDAAVCASAAYSETSLEVQKELQKIPMSQFLFKGEAPDFTKQGALDLSSGSYGVAKAMLDYGAPWVLTYDWQHSAAEDLLVEEKQVRIKYLVKNLAFRSVGMAPICASFSVAVTPPVRSAKYPRGKPGLTKNMKVKVSAGNRHLDFNVDVVEDCYLLDLAFFLENPDLSWFWRQKKTEKFRAPGSERTFRLSFCRFGTPWMKNTRIATSTRLAGLRMMCAGCSSHHRLRGYSKKHKRSWTSVAEPYPRGLARLLACALCAKAGWCSNRRLNLAECARVGSMRVGEAKNPGPQRPATHRFGVSLEELPTLSSTTMLMEARLLERFLDWCGLELVTLTPGALFDLHPPLLALALRTYGDLMFQKQGSLANFRRLILACQRWKMGARPFMAPAWELDPEAKAAYLQLRTFKSLTRQPAKIQHMKIADPEAVVLLTKIFFGYQTSRPLYFGSPHQYRRRWDFVLKTFQVPSSCRLTPGGLRGGAAVAAYRAEVPIPEIQWRMRIRQQSTLESYLQETGTLTVYSELPEQVRGAWVVYNLYFVKVVFNTILPSSPAPSIRCSCDVQFIMPSAAADHLQRQIAQGSKGIDEVVASLSQVDSEKAQAWKMEDEVKVKLISHETNNRLNEIKNMLCDLLMFFQGVSCFSEDLSRFLDLDVLSHVIRHA